MSPEMPGSGPMLILDTCTGSASIALFRDTVLLGEIRLLNRAASVDLLPAVRTLLDRHKVRLMDLRAIAVVNGPGSFTGVRVGLAAAKGMCEATGRPLAAVSRLAVLADAAQITDGLAVLGAGRDQVYVREPDVTGEAREWLATSAELTALLPGKPIAVEYGELAERLTQAGAEARPVHLSARHAFGVVQRSLAHGSCDVASSDANYVRNEESIYTRAAHAH